MTSNTQPPVVPEVIRTNTILFAGVNLEARLMNNLLNNTSCCISLALVLYEVNFLLPSFIAVHGEEAIVH